MGMIGQMHQRVTNTLNDQRSALGKPRIEWGSVFNKVKPQTPRPPVSPMPQYRGRAGLVQRAFRERLK